MPNTIGKNIEGEQIFAGLNASKGLVKGKIYIYKRHEFKPDSETISKDEIEQEITRLKEALARSKKELLKIESVTEQKLGEVFSEIFSAQIMMLSDAVLLDRVYERIRSELKRADIIIDEEITRYQDIMASSDDSNFQERSQDIKDLKERIIRNLHAGTLLSKIKPNTIVVSSLLTPADVILFSRQDILGYATDGGGITSHAALICRSLNIPMVVGLHNVSEKARTGDMAIIDGYLGQLILNPTKERLLEFEEKRKVELESDKKLEATKSITPKTKCGKPIRLYSNIDFKEEIINLKKVGSTGVGLFRSESLFISSGKAPSEQEQYEYYHSLATDLAPMPLVIRLFDVGGDKLLISAYQEQNPNLGWRGIRILIDVPEVLENQIRAILRANTSGNIHLLLPMVSSLEEIEFIQKRLEEISDKMKHEGYELPHKLPVGVMIEIPSAVEIIDEIVQISDFVSVGTNDLIQYTLAVDRNNDVVQDLYRKFHPAIVRMLGKIIESAKRGNCSVSVCGEIAADPLATPLLIGLGLEEFSLVNSSIPELKSVLASVTLAECQELAQTCLSMNKASCIEEELRQFAQAHRS